MRLLWNLFCFHRPGKAEGGKRQLLLPQRVGSVIQMIGRTRAAAAVCCEETQQLKNKKKKSKKEPTNRPTADWTGLGLVFLFLLSLLWSSKSFPTR